MGYVAGTQVLQKFLKMSTNLRETLKRVQKPAKKVDQVFINFFAVVFINIFNDATLGKTSI